MTAGRPGQGPPASFLTIADRPPTPPLPDRRWGRSSALITPSLDQHQSRQAAPSFCHVTSVSATDFPTEFAVFDVYHHARLLPCPSTASDLHLLQLAIAATPEFGGAVHFRMLTHLLPGLPRRQLVLWGDLLPGSVVFPVSFGSGVNSVCTIEVPEPAVQACTFLCRHCQLPEVIIERLADLDLRLVVNGNVVYPLDPMACAQADSAVLLGDLFSAISLNSHRLSFVRGTQTPSSSSAPSVVSHPVDDDHSHFVVFLESRPAQLLPVTAGSTVTDLVIAAIERFPELGPYTGHRVLARPVPGLPPIQVCLWGVLGVGERVLPVSTANSASPFCVIRIRTSLTPTQIALVVGETIGLGGSLGSGVLQRRYHVCADGRPLQPEASFAARAADALSINAGPPPARMPGMLPARWAPRAPHALDSVLGTDVSDADPVDLLVVHRLGHTPTVVEVSHLLRPIAASASVAQQLGLGHSYRFRFPYASPLCFGAPAHCVLSQPGVYAFAIFDLRRVLRPPWAPFITLEVPAIVTFHKVLDLLADLRPFLESIAAVYVDEHRLDTGVSPCCNACTITLLGQRQTGPHVAPASTPALLDTHAAVSRRLGFALASVSRAGSSSTSTTTAALSTTVATTEASHVGPQVCVSEAASFSGPAPGSGPPSFSSMVTNPDLLDFVSDPVAISRLDASEAALYSV